MFGRDATSIEGSSNWALGDVSESTHTTIISSRLGVTAEAAADIAAEVTAGVWYGRFNT